MDAALRDQVVVITGASGGIGSATARAFAAEGACLVLHCHQGMDRARRLSRELHPAKCLVVQADLRKESGARRLIATSRRHFGRVDTLVANAGSWEARDIPLHQMSLAQWKATFECVLTSTFLCLREFLATVAEQKRGNAVLVGSTAAVFGEAGHADYAAAKSAMAFGLTRTLKNEIARLAPHTATYGGGRVNCVCPGWTVVPRNAAKLRKAETVRRVTATMALPKVGRPEDMARMIVFLASDHLSGHVTGQTIVVAGGMEGRWLWRPEEVDPAIA